MAVTPEFASSSLVAPPISRWSIPGTWVTVYSAGDMGNTVGPNGLSIGSKRQKVAQVVLHEADEPNAVVDLQKLGISVSQATVAKYMLQRDKPPSQPCRSCNSTALLSTYPVQAGDPKHVERVFALWTSAAEPAWKLEKIGATWKPRN